MKIYDIQTELRELLDTVSETGELTEAQADLMDKLHGELEEKQKGIIYYIKEAKAFEAVIAEEEKKLKAKKEVLKNKQGRLLDLLEMTMHMENKKELQFGDVSAKFALTPPALEVDDESQVPEEYFKVVKTLDKATLKDAVKEGLEIDGVRLTQKETLRIK